MLTPPLSPILPMLLCLQTAGQGAPVATSPTGTPLWIQGTKTVPLRVGQPIEGTLVYPIFAANELVFPAGSVAHGTVVALAADRSHRLQARLRGDFTPFSRPVVQFQELVLPNGTRVALPLGTARDGAPVLKLTPPPPARGGFLRREFHTGVGMVKDRVRLVTAPGRGSV